jgi:hypothetical protein
MGFRVTQLIYVAAKLDLADHLARGPLTAPELASSLVSTQVRSIDFYRHLWPAYRRQ